MDERSRSYGKTYRRFWDGHSFIPLYDCLRSQNTGYHHAPGYAPKPYVQNGSITRGAARLVYARQDLNGNGTYEQNEVYVFYTHNHYNDFREYLNYYGGWGEMFGNVTGGGEYSSKTDANPTPYVPTAYADFSQPDLENAA